MTHKAKDRFLLVLASGSTARKELLESVGLPPDIVAPSDINEYPGKGELPRNFVKRMAKEKALIAAKKYPDNFIIAADTIAVCGTRIIGKAENKNDAREILNLLSGRRHKVLTGLCIIAPDGTRRMRVISTVVTFKRLEKKEIEGYLVSGQWQGKSGCYGLQSQGGGFVTSINGSYSSVVGLPVAETRAILISLGYKSNYENN